MKTIWALALYVLLLPPSPLLQLLPLWGLVFTLVTSGTTFRP